MSRNRRAMRDAAVLSRDPLFDDPALAEALAACAAQGRLSDEDVRTMRSRRRAAASSGLAVLLVAVGVGAWWTQEPASAPAPQIAWYQTARGQQRDLRLADGSTLRMNGGTRVGVTFAADHRDVRLAAGEAYFDVAHDPARPFTVHAGATDARVLGTAFDLDLRRAQVDLSVYRGAVRFGRTDGDLQRTVVVQAGWRSRFADGNVTAPRQFDTGRQDWRQGWIDTDDMSLGDLVDALNRQGGPLVETPPPALAAIIVGGRFRLDDPAQLLDAIGAAYGFRVERDGKAIRLVQS